MFVKVSDNSEANLEDCIELPVEPEGHILMSTLIAQFPGACGLKFKKDQSSWRGVRVVEGKINPPGDDKWDENIIYHVTYPKDSKRKGEDLDVNSAKNRKIEKKSVDLIVLGIPWKSSDDVVRQYFEQYGEVVLCEIKRDSSNNSKGFGFVRFKEYEHQCLVLGKKHFIDGRWCDVKIPNSQEPETSRKIFVGRLTEALSSQDLQDYFSKFGQVIDVYIPKPFRAFGFVTFVEAEIARSLCGESHIIKGISVHVSRADPKDDEIENSTIVSSSIPYHSGSGTNSSHQFSSSHGHYHSHHHINRSHSQYNYSPNGFRNDGSRHSKSAIQQRSKQNKADYKTNDSYDRHNNGIRGGNNGNGSVFNQNHQHNPMMQNDAMSMMSNMFNPMMAAFIQQIAAQTQSIQPQQSANGSVPYSASSIIDSSSPTNLGTVPVQSQSQWNHAHHHHHQTQVNAGFNGTGIVQQSQQHHSRFKEKKF